MECVCLIALRSTMGWYICCFERRAGCLHLVADNWSLHAIERSGAWCLFCLRHDDGVALSSWPLFSLLCELAWSCQYELSSTKGVLLHLRMSWNIIYCGIARYTTIVWLLHAATTLLVVLWSNYTSCCLWSSKCCVCFFSLCSELAWTCQDEVLFTNHLFVDSECELEYVEMHQNEKPIPFYACVAI